MTEEQLREQFADAKGWRRQLRYLVNMAIAGGVLYAAGVDPFLALVGGAVAATGWVCSLSALMGAAALLAIAARPAEKKP
jgi:hypothetical protein